MKVILPLLLLTAAPQAFASQCNTQMQISATDHKALYDDFQAKLISVKQKLNQGDKNTRKALDALSLQLYPGTLGLIPHFVDDFFEELGIQNEDTSIKKDVSEAIIEYNNIQKIAPKKNSFEQLCVALLIEFKVLDKNGQLICERSYNNDDIKGCLLVGGNTQEN